MNVVPDFASDPQAAEPVQMGEGTLHNPALSAQSGAVSGAPAGNDRLDTEVPDEVTVLVVIVAAVTEHDVRGRRGLPRLPRTGGTAWRSGMSWVTSLRLPPVRGAASGMPVASVIKLCLLPVPPRSTGFRPVFDRPLTPEYESRRPPPGRSPGHSPRAAWRGVPRGAVPTRQLRSTQPGAASTPCQSRSRAPEACAPRQSRCAARTGCPEIPTSPDAACVLDAESSARWSSPPPVSRARVRRRS